PPDSEGSASMQPVCTSRARPSVEQRVSPAFAAGARDLHGVLLSALGRQRDADPAGLNDVEGVAGLIFVEDDCAFAERFPVQLRRKAGERLVADLRKQRDVLKHVFEVRHSGYMAVGVGFEPTRRLPAYALSRRAG